MSVREEEKDNEQAKPARARRRDSVICYMCVVYVSLSNQRWEGYSKQANEYVRKRSSLTGGTAAKSNYEKTKAKLGSKQNQKRETKANEHDG